MMRRKSLVLVLSLILAAAIPAVADEVITITLARSPLFGFTGPLEQSYILLGAGNPTICYVLSPGGGGGLFVADGQLGVNSTNFLVRSRHLRAGAAQLGTGDDGVEQGSCVAVLDAATDFLFRPRILREFRRSSQRISDIAAVIQDLRDKLGNNIRIVLEGTSRGTIDMAEAATQLDVDALVLSSPVTQTSSGTPDFVFNVDLSQVRVPTLLVFHKDDACFVTPPEDVKLLRSQLINVPTIRVRGFEGGFPPVDPNPCQATTFHGFLGKEADVIRAITRWISQVLR